MSLFDYLNPLKNITINLTESQLTEINNWFSENSLPQLIINTEEPVHVVTVEKLMQFLELKKYHKRNFHFPTYNEIMKEAENFKVGVTRILTKDQIIFMLNKWLILPDIKHELKLAFSVFDTEKRGFLDIDELQTTVTLYSDAFSETEVRELLRDANVRGDGNVFYDDFVESLFRLAPELYEIKVDYLYENPDEDPSVSPDPVDPNEIQ